jgi:antitoxin VapB
MSLSPLNIKDAETCRLARELAQMTGESLTETVRTALRQRLDQESRRERRRDPALRAEIEEIIAHCSSLPVLDSRSDDEIIGYDEHGAPR